MAEKNPYDDPNIGLPAQGPNPYDDPDIGKGRTAGDVVKDVAVTAVKGAIAVPETMVGLLDTGPIGMAVSAARDLARGESPRLRTGGIGKSLDDAGLSFKSAQDFMSEQYSKPQQEAFRKVHEAEGLGGTVLAALENPSTIAHTIGQSLGPMGVGGVVSRAALKMAPKLAPRIAGAIGEGLATAGMGAEQLRQETEEGLLTPTQAALMAGSGALTGVIGGASGKLANKLGISDFETAMASGRLAGSKLGTAGRMGAGVVTEGLLEEMPQSYQEQVAQNLAKGKPWDEGAAEAAGMGALVGGVMGAGANLFSGEQPAPPPAPPAPPPLALPAPGDANARVPGVAFPMGEGPVGTAVAGDLERQAAAEHAAAVYAARDAEDARKADLAPVEPGPASPWMPPALPAPEDAHAAAPLTPPALDPNQGPFQPVMDLAQQSAADRAAEREAARAAEEDRRLAAFAAQGPLSAAAATSMGTGMHQAARAARAGEANPEVDPMALPVPIGEEAKALNKTLQERLQKAPSMSLQEAQAARDKAAARDRKAVVLPHPSGGFTIAPASFVAPEVARQFKSLQKAGTLPSPDSNIPGEYTVDSQGNARPSTYGEQNRGQREAFAEMRRQNDTPSQPPIKTAEAAKIRANNLTMQTGVEHEVVPHPMSSTAFAVRPTPAVVEGEVTEKRMGLSPTAEKARNRGTSAEPARNQRGIAAEPAAGKPIPETGTAVPNPGNTGNPGIPENAPALSGIDQAAHEAATSLHNDRRQPTAAQAAAGNYKKGHVRLHGLDITVENPAGSVRVDVNGEWANVAPHHYGYIKRTTGKDGDQVDVHVGKTESDRAFVIDQVDPKTGKIDEHKVMLNFGSKAEAEAAYRAAYPADWQGFGKIREMDVPALKRWLKHGDNPKPDLSAQALDGLKISIPTEVAETGEVVQVKQDARAALTDARSRVRRLEQLQRCIG